MRPRILFHSEKHVEDFSFWGNSAKRVPISSKVIVSLFSCFGLATKNEKINKYIFQGEGFEFAKINKM
jgi:hypothetical protein